MNNVYAWCTHVLGFAFVDGLLLVKRAHKPEHLRGYLNGLGGKIEPGETTVEAMVREFREESGALTKVEDWRLLGVMHCDGAHIALLHCTSEYIKVSQLRPSLEGDIYLVSPSELQRNLNVVPNLRWLVPLCFDIRLSWLDVTVVT